MKRLLFLLMVIMAVSSVCMVAQTPRVAFLPFKNMDGKIELNKWCYALQDSLQKHFAELDPNNEKMYVVPYDSVELILSELNLDPSNPQFDSDMWKVVENLNVNYVISGNFVFQAQRFLINTYIYDVSMKLQVNSHQARDIFVPMDKVLNAIKPIAKKLQGFFIK